MKKIIITSVLFLFISWVQAQEIKTPSAFLGYELGKQFTRHATVVDYFEYVAQNSNWVTYQEYGKTNELRPLTYAVISTPENLSNIEEIRKAHLQSAGLTADGATSTPDKAIVWLSYNVHGNEASSTEAAMLTLYTLITAKKEWLKDLIVIIDPCVNPDGRDRYANWFNQVRSTPYDSSQISAEHNEPWPGGRPNHYLFDLNRDWAWASQIETQQRLKVYNQWMPHIHVDFHEQGINEPYYFAPAAEPFHEIISDFQREFQTEIGKNHAKYFDKEGWLYFTKERFDLLYPSYGDTYPTYMGAIGMTYEQAGHSRGGLGVITDEGFELTLIDRIAHHTTTGLSTVEVAANNVARLNTEFHKYFDNKNLVYKSYVLQGKEDNLNALTALLDQHEIKYGYAASGKATGYDYETNKEATLNYNHALVVSTDQPKGKMVQALFENDAKLSTPLTYDITAWSLPHAYGLKAISSKKLVPSVMVTPAAFAANKVATTSPGYIAKWNSLIDAQFLAELLKNDIRVRVSEKPFTNGVTQYDRGTLIITRSDNQNLEGFDAKVVAIANKHKRALTASTSSFASVGPDFGSPDIKLINKPRIALLKGYNTSSLSYGAIWFFLEQELKYPVTSIDTDYFKQISLDQFDVLILPNGYYGGYFDDATKTKLKSWVRNGGKLIAISRAVDALAGEDGFGVTKNDAKKDKEDKDKDTLNKLIPYADREMSQVTNFITGSIFKTTVDNTHPLAFGYDKTYYTLKLGNSSYSYLEDGYNVGYIETPENVSGFAGEKALTKLTNSLVFGENPMGGGSVIFMVDDPLFRDFWYNGKLLFANALFMVNNNVYSL